MNLFETQEYRELSIKHNYNIISYLIKNGVGFSIICHTNVIDFNPPIPKEIIEFGDLVRFDIFNYTFDSSVLNEESLTFEAGFGEENFGSIVTVPLDAIYQIIVDDLILSLNYFKPKPKIEPNSMEILLKNPENLKLLRKKKKV